MARAIVEPKFDHLFAYERSALIEALRRDADNERLKALENPGSAAYHLENARVNVRIIEAFGFLEERWTTPFNR